LLLEGTTQSPVLRMTWIVAAPLVSEIAVRPWLIVVRSLVRARCVHGPEAERRVEHPWFSNAALSIEKRHGLTVDFEARDIIETHGATGTKLNGTQKRERR
jgi:hypothetical protein